MPDLAIRCPQPCPEAASLATQVSSHCDAGNRQIQDLRIPLFADRIRALTESFDPNYLIRGAPWFGKLEGTCADGGLTEVP
jgi:hypothetical protein